MCVVTRRDSYQRAYEGVRIYTQSEFTRDGNETIKTVYETEQGTLSTLSKRNSGSSWCVEHLFKTPDDYKALRCLVQSTRYIPQYQSAAQLIKRLGEDHIVRDLLPSEPLQRIILDFMGTETFCYEWMDNRDEVLKLYDLLVEKNRQAYSIVAEGPMIFANYGGNVTPEIIGRDVFREYYAVHYNEAAEVLHKSGKLIGSHFDANNTTIMDDLAELDLDYIEAYDPGMSPPVSEARRVLGNKVLWINWPSAFQLDAPDAVQERTVDMIRQAGSGEGFVIGITEDVPADRWQQNFTAIMDGIDAFEQQRKIKIR